MSRALAKTTVWVFNLDPCIRIAFHLPMPGRSNELMPNSRHTHLIEVVVEVVKYSALCTDTQLSPSIISTEKGDSFMRSNFPGFTLQHNALFTLKKKGTFHLIKVENNCVVF